MAPDAPKILVEMWLGRPLFSAMPETDFPLDGSGTGIAGAADKALVNVSLDNNRDKE